MSQKSTVRINVNGTLYERQIEPRILLSDFLRHELGLTGTHVGCEHGICGACTIHLDGQPVRSCLTFAIQVDGREIRTVESLAAAENITERKNSIGNVEEARPSTEAPMQRILPKIWTQRPPFPTEQIAKTIARRRKPRNAARCPCLAEHGNFP